MESLFWMLSLLSTLWAAFRGGGADQQVAIGHRRLRLLQGLDEQGEILGDQLVVGVEEGNIAIPGVVHGLVPARRQPGIGTEGQAAEPVL